ncbi:hypothetical protein Z945_2221 [Sulfitobacter noctilucae]|uniref:hypothetical protein n=1 Tax=Sulfitobacter noctilucae TaxID=1342302 RepID=UPI000AF6EF57|nr:hypothetical protein [Sulfitobacter noctilucae]KIN61231.1 hypothetical protein Z945_2221 [Sulfitobacter noctilucae]
MQPVENALIQIEDPQARRLSLRLQQIERLDLLEAASEADTVCPVWVSERFGEREGVPA